MENSPLYRRDLKTKARGVLAAAYRVLVPLISILLLVGLVTLLLEMTFGRFLFQMIVDTNTTPMQTGIWLAPPTLMSNLLAQADSAALGASGGIVASLHIESAATAMVLLLPWRGLVTSLLVQGAIFVLTAPLYLAAFAFLQAVLRGEAPAATALVSWYRAPRQLARSLGLLLALGAWRTLVRFACMVPGIVCLTFAARASDTLFLSLMALLLSILGVIASYYLVSLLHPAQYLLAQSPELSVFAALRAGVGALSGRRKGFFRLRLSYLPIELLSAVLSGMLDPFIFVYEGLACLLFWQGEAASTPLEKGPESHV